MCSREHSVAGWVAEVEIGRSGEVEVEGWEIVVAVEGEIDSEEGGIVVEIVLVLEFVEIVGCTDRIGVEDTGMLKQAMLVDCILDWILLPP